MRQRGPVKFLVRSVLPEKQKEGIYHNVEVRIEITKGYWFAVTKAIVAYTTNQPPSHL